MSKMIGLLYSRITGFLEQHRQDKTNEGKWIILAGIEHETCAESYNT